MPSFTDFKDQKRVKALIIGDSGSGKTGLLATLANAGYNLRIIDLENNLNVIGSYLKGDAAKNIHYASLDPNDKRALEGINALVRHWKIGTEDLGPTKDWTNKEVLVIDSTTKLGDVCLNCTSATNKDDRTHYMNAGEEFQNLMSFLLDPSPLRFNVVCLAHIRYVAVQSDKVADTMTMKAYPTSVGSKLPISFARGFTDVFGIKVSAIGQNVKRVIRTDADSMMGMKSSNPSKLKLEEEFDLGVIFNKLLT